MNYGHDVLSEPVITKKVVPTVPARVGLFVEHRVSGFTGTIARADGRGIELRNARMKETRVFPWMDAAWLVDGKPCTLVKPGPGPLDTAPKLTASGSVASGSGKARVAAASRIWVEGLHDAELVEKVWGDDLRREGIVVEPLHGVDDLAGAVADFAPNPARRLGILVDHLVAGSKESRLAAAVRDPNVLVTGTPYVDVWQAVRPKAVGIAAWPVVPPGRPWKDGVMAGLGARGEARDFWRALLGKVRGYADLEPELVGAVERLIDFVAEPPSAP